MKLYIEYFANGKRYVSTKEKNDHFDIAINENNNDIKININSNTDIEIRNFTVSYPYEFSKDSRIFPNGYESWTDCREMFVDEIPQHFSPLPNLAFNKTSLGASGAYYFTNNEKRRGVFTAFSYLYVRNGEEFDLFASLNEKTGYTIIETDTENDYINIRKELEGVKINGSYELLNITKLRGKEDEVFDLWFKKLGVLKPTVTPKTGYTTWYNYYPNINEKIVSADLEALSKVDEKIDIFQIDDGYQTAVGDWLSVDDEKFPKGMKNEAEKIHSKNMLAGIWLAPFGAQYKSKVAKEHPDWLIKNEKGKFVKCGPNWGGFYALDIEKKEVREYIKNFFDVILNTWGYDLVKLDFLYAAAIIPRNNKTRGQLMSEAMDFLRECVGEKLILGCGVPLAPAFGKVDYCRIGADMGLKWQAQTFGHREFVSTINTLGNSIFRRQLDKRAFLNDPDVFLLRDSNMKCTFEQRKIIATVNKIFGSVLFTSDNVGEYRKEQMDKLLEVFKKDEIIVKSAEFDKGNRRAINISYLENEKEKTFSFDLDNGKIL